MPRLFRSGIPKLPKSWERMDEDQLCHNRDTDNYLVKKTLSSEKRQAFQLSQNTCSISALEESLEWDKSRTEFLSPRSITEYDDFFSEFSLQPHGTPIFRAGDSNQREYDSIQFSKESGPDSRLKLVPTLASIFATFWERADLYTDVLGLEDDHPTPRQLHLCFFRHEQTVLATPIETIDDMTMLRLGIKSQNISTIGDDSNSMGVIKSAVEVSRRAKLRFQAISFAYEILNDKSKRKHYNEWRLCNSRLPPPPFELKDSTIQIDQSTESSSITKKLINKEIQGYELDVESRTSVYSSMYSHTGSILQPSRYGNRKLKRIASNRNIRWNEEVEELVILEGNYNSNNDSVENINRIEYWNGAGLRDIYSKILLVCYYCSTE